jgi:hypothetical protein
LTAASIILMKSSASAIIEDRYKLSKYSYRIRRG